MADKHASVGRAHRGSRPATVWDLGANTGAFSRLAADAGRLHGGLRRRPRLPSSAIIVLPGGATARVLPLVMDLANPSGRIGWNHAERLSLADRGPADLVLALGLMHHLSLANQVPFAMAAEFFHRAGRTLVVEFVPRSDSQVVGMLSRMPRLQDGYSLEAFERAFGSFFES